MGGKFMRPYAGATIAGALILAALATPAVAQQRIAGTLEPQDEELADGEFSDSYPVEGRAGQTLTVTLASTDFDAYLGVVGDNDFIVENDDADGGDGTDAALSTTLPSDGTYVIMVTSYEAGETGAYVLEYALSGSSGAPAEDEASPELLIGGSTSGRLEATDVTRGDGAFMDVYDIHATPGTRLRFSMRSDEFDTYLGISDMAGNDLFNDDMDDGDTTDSAVEAVIPMSGYLRVEASSFEEGETGSYTLSVEAAGR